MANLYVFTILTSIPSILLAKLSKIFRRVREAILRANKLCPHLLSFSFCLVIYNVALNKRIIQIETRRKHRYIVMHNSIMTKPSVNH